MPDQTEIPVSSFPDAQSINGGDKVTGLQNNSNTNFTFSSIMSWLVNAFRAVFVPNTRTVNGKTLDTNITLNASDVGARPSTWTPSVTDIGAQPVITASGILKGDGAGGVAAATAGTDYATPAQIPSVPSAYTSNPTMNGTASPGSSGAWARGDHVHPSDTSKANETELAYVENGSTASRAYIVGEYFCRNGQTCRAKTAIAQGATLTLDTNYEVPAGGGFNSIISNTLTRVYALGSSSLKTYADSFRTGGFVEWVEYYSTNPDAPSNYHGYAQIIFMSSNYITVIAYDRNGKIYQMRKASSWGAWITLH